jgi:hypothetical protein
MNFSQSELSDDQTLTARQYYLNRAAVTRVERLGPNVGVQRKFR